MAPNNNNDENNLNGHPSKHLEDGEESNQSENDREVAGAEEGMPRRSRRHSDNNPNNGNRSRQPKRNFKPHSRCIIPEARVIQGYDECAYISEHEEDESEREYLPRPIRRRIEVVQFSSRHEIPQPQEEVKVKNNASFLSKFKAAKGDGLRHSARCFCFNCW
mmetsp:Transcript_3942/g.6062  ORF Transcript_3942/g.6062 Transcript_3942/m.6062 type:complete len:162 (+) Transcript_3942:81-566(+)